LNKNEIDLVRISIALFFPWLTYEIIQERFNITPYTFTGEEDGKV